MTPDQKRNVLLGRQSPRQSPWLSIAPLVTRPAGDISRKVQAATSGATVGSAIAVLVMGFINRQGFVLSDAESSSLHFLVEWAILGLIGVAIPAACAWVAGYMTRERAPK